MDTRDLDSLTRVLRLGSFAAAARELGVDPSSVSRSVAALETELGTRLFQRNTRQLALTEAGLAFVEHMEPALDALAQARTAALNATGEVRGRLRISVSNAFGIRRLSPLLPAFCAAYPALELDVNLSEAPVDMVAERIDVALRLSNLRDSNLIAVPLLRIKYHVAASPAWLRAQTQPPVVPQDLQSHLCLCFAHLNFQDCWKFKANGPRATAEKTLAADQPADQPEVIEVPIRPRLVSTNALMLRECALGGLGPTLMADWMIGEDIASGALVDLFPHHQAFTAKSPTSGWAVYPSRSHVPAKVRVFVDFLRAAMSPGR